MAKTNLPKAQSGASIKAFFSGAIKGAKAGIKAAKAEKSLKELAELRKARAAKGAKTRALNKEKKAAESFYEGLGARGARPSKIVKEGNVKDLPETKVTATRTKADVKKGKQNKKAQKKVDKQTTESGRPKPKFNYVDKGGKKGTSKSTKSERSLTDKIMTGVAVATLPALAGYNALRNKAPEKSTPTTKEKPKAEKPKTTTTSEPAMPSLWLKPKGYKKGGSIKTGAAKYSKMSNKQTRSAASAVKSISTAKPMVRPSIKKR